MSFIHASLISHKIMVCAFLDIKGAFDNVCLDILIEDLKRLGVPACTLRFIFKILVERHVYFVVNGTLRGPFTSRRGTSQSS